MKSIRFSKTTGLVLAALLGLSGAVVQAAGFDPAGVQVTPEQQNGYTFLNGGIGKDEATAIRAAKGYNLKLTFATGPTNAFLADVGVDIRAQGGKQVLTLDNAGPLVYAQLPNGDYDVAVSSGGQTQHKMVAIRGGREVNIQPSGERDIAASAEVGPTPRRMTAIGPARAANFHWPFEVNKLD